MEEIARGHKDSRRHTSNPRKAISNHSKRATSPKTAMFYGKKSAMDRQKFVKSGHQKIVSVTNGFELYKAEKAYADVRPVKAKQHSKRPLSKKQHRIR